MEDHDEQLAPPGPIYPFVIRYIHDVSVVPHSFWPLKLPRHLLDLADQQDHQEPVQDNPPILEPFETVLQKLRKAVFDDENDPSDDLPQDQEPVLPEKPPSLKLAEIVLQKLQDEKEYGSISDDLHQDQEPVSQDQPPKLKQVEMVLQELQEQPTGDGDDDNDGVIPYVPEPVIRPEGEENTDYEYEVDDEVRVPKFEICHPPDWSEQGEEIRPVFVLNIPQYPASFLIHRKYGQPGPLPTAIVTYIPLHLCGDYESFFERVWSSFEIVTRSCCWNHPGEELIPGYHMSYTLAEPPEVILDLDGISWECFRERLRVVGAYEY